MGQQKLSVHSGYYDLLQWTGLEVLHGEKFGKRKGDYLFAVAKRAEDGVFDYGLVVVGYGSCEGCDVLKALMPPPGVEKWDPDNLAFVETFAYELADNVVWGNRGQLLHRFYEPDNALLQWWGHTEGYSDALAGCLQYIPEADQ